MSNLKEKLLSSYFDNDISESVNTKKSKYTPLRRFVDFIGLDWKNLSPEQMEKWARTKRFKNFRKMRKIKRISVEADVNESIIYENYDLFMREFIESDSDDIISDLEVISFFAIIESLQKRVIAKKAHQFGARGHYKSAAQKAAETRKTVLSAINKGSTISSGEGDVQFGGRGRKGQKALGQGKVAIRTPYRTKSGIYKLHRTTLR